ncbi:hypothetical protein GF339_17680 [candidate division KSB3 bacterium]|uniref:Uncharacterized protein n=1 Tax=candidate division KSB3 bacterium TaxID=2044937 RepID=A0A9D5JYL7_9BACT|nr:hypothetical protein [candidate division KSB3 bacterium]
MSVPIRVDLLALIPLFEVMFVAATTGWFLAARKYKRLVGFPMSLVMGIVTIAWPIYVAIYLLLSKIE